MSLTFLTEVDKLLCGKQDFFSETVDQRCGKTHQCRKIGVVTTPNDKEKLAEYIQYFRWVLNNSFEKQQRSDITESQISKKPNLDQQETFLNAGIAINHAYKRNREECSKSTKSKGVKRVAQRSTLCFLFI
jgi:hypothetical protein